MKRGSALLIVLGLLSFLVVSAVAFSAFMRDARRPSSYLLRTSSSRLLVKAGLAEAMDALETAIGDNAHPGIGGTGDANKWVGRVFYGRMAGGEKTVPTLSLEGLAYIPFSLINAARYHSRRTPTAAWHSFRFDSGRYAYTAIDVSDYFDVNRVMAAPGGGGRTSAADGRVTLAYLFEDAGHSGWRTPPTAWDDFMDNFLDDSNSGSKVPLVSVADLNLAVQSQKPKGVRSPWCEFIEGKSSQFMPDGEEARVQSNMVFVTDSWYPSATANDELDIASAANQPFYGLSIGNATDYRKRGVDEIAMMSQNAFSRRFSTYLRLPEYVQLCDYLDVDSVPTSLALPVTERVPMIVGVSLAGANSLGLSATRATRTVGAAKDGEASYEVTTYTLKLTGTINPVIATVYPFKHQRGSDDNAVFRVQLAATVTLVPKDSVGKVRLQSAKSPAVFTKDAWTENELNPTPKGYDGAKDFKPVVAMCSAPVQLQLKRKPGSASECLLEMPIQGFQFNGIALSSKIEKSQFDPTGSGDDCTLRVVEKVDPDTGNRTVVETTKGFLPSNADLSGTFASRPADLTDSEEFAPVVQVWVRVLNADGDTVDLMPACAADDARTSQLLGSLTKDLPAQAVRPVLRFADAGKSVSISRNSLEALAKTPVEIGRSPQAYVADDPRFNYAPEDLFTVGNLSGKLGDTWLDKVTAPGATKEEKDIFMETSDAGYLQSKYELAFLLDVTGFGSSMWGELESYKGGGSAKDAMWSAYTPYPSPESGTGYADVFRDKLKIVNGNGAMAICPYTPDVAIMMGALANTPYDWWAASTNDVSATKRTMLADPKAALDYTFSEHALDPSARVKWNDLEELAKTFISSFRAMGTDADGKPSWSGWDVKYDGFAWNGALFDNIEDNSNVTLDAVDRKFLYGYWRECFAVRQQLFLVFVRAEPMMMGGGSNIRPVMGARAVALVWRDPAKPANGGPHRMRVLFYRQLD